MNSVIGKKIVIVGCPGSGKSMLARRLHERTGLPVVHLDNVFWKPDKTHISKEEFDNKLAELLKADEWILDGNYSRTLSKRIEQADTVIVLDYPLDVCLAGARERVGKVRDDLPWIEDKLDWEELEEWIKDFPSVEMPKVYTAIEECGKFKNIVVFHSREEADEWLTTQM